jgi:hypothetical protein
MKISVRLFLGLFFLLLSFFVLKSVSFAQTSNAIQPQQNSSDLTSNTNPDVPKNLHNWTQSTLIETIAAISCQITGMDPTNPNQKCLGVDQKTGKIGFVENGEGAIGLLSSNLSLLYTPPLHTGDYISYLSNNFGGTKPSYAAGYTGKGFNSLSPLINIWTSFRNITYLFFVIIFLVIGVAIMLRVKIDPRTVMTIQNQIPKIIIGIVLVTFSFAISGLLIDFMWTSMYVSFGVMSNTSHNIVGSDISDLSPVKMIGSSPLDMYGGFVKQINPTTDAIPAVIAPRLRSALEQSLGITSCTGTGSNLLDCANNLINPLTALPNISSPNVINTVINIASDWLGAKGFMFGYNWMKESDENVDVLGNSAGTFPGWVTGSATGAVLGGVVHAFTELLLRDFLPYLIIYLIVYIAVLVTLLRLWFELIKAYIFVLFDVIFAPFWILAGLIPGNTSVNFTSWLKDIVSNLAVFPAVALMFWIGKILMDSVYNSSTSTGVGSTLFVPPLIGNPNDAQFLVAIIGLGILLSTPQVIVMVKKALKAPSGSLLGGAGQAISAGIAIPMAGVKGVGKFYGKTPEMGKRGGFGALIRGFTG